MIYIIGFIISFISLCLLDSLVETEKGDLDTSIIVIFSLLWFLVFPIMFFLVIYNVLSIIHHKIKNFIKNRK